jgi:uncharacterized membrane protein
MQVPLLLDVVHVLTAMLFVAGLIGRAATFWRAGQAQDVQTVDRGVILLRRAELVMAGLVTALMIAKPF